MLLGEDLRRGHERGLVTGFDGQEHGAEGDQRFTRADVAVEQAVHGARRREVGADFRDRALLRAGQWEGEGGVQAAHQVVGRAVDRSRLRDLFRPFGRNAELHGEELTEHEVPPRLFQVLRTVGKMNLAPGPGPRRGIQGGWHQGFHRIVLEQFQHIPDQPAQDPRREAFGRAVNRGEAVQVQRNLRIVFHDFELGVRDDDAGFSALRLPINNQPMPRHDHLLHPVGIEPAAGQRLAEGVWIFLLQQHVEHFLPAAETPEAGLFLDHPADAHRLVAVARGKVVEAGAVLVAFWKMGEQPFDRRDADTLELPSARRRNPVQFGQQGGGMHEPTLAEGRAALAKEILSGVGSIPALIKY